MSLLGADPDGLKSLAEECESWSAEVAVTSAPTILTRPVQATAAAVTVIHAQLCSTGSMLSARMRGTATALTDAACGYTVHDGDSVAALDGLTIGR